METITLEQASLIAEIVGSIAVVFSLIYVGIGVRQNARAVRLNTGQVVAQELREAVRDWCHEDVARVMVKAAVDPNVTGTEKLQFYAMMNNLMRVVENGHFQFASNALDPRLWHGFIRNIADVMSTPGAKAYWVARKSWFSKEYQQYFEQQILPLAQPEYKFAGIE